MVDGEEITRTESCFYLRNSIFLFLERLEYRTVKNNIIIALVCSGFERVTALKQIYLLVCSHSGSCWRRQVWSLRSSHVDVLLFGGCI